MCYKAGPRCYKHAKEAHDATVVKVAKQEAVVADLEESYRAEKAESAKYSKLFKKAESASEHLALLQDKERVAFDEMQQTSEGVRKLSDNLAKVCKEKGDNSPEARAAEYDYRQASRGFAKKMYAYDLENQTVDGKLPSGYASTIGLEHLNEQDASLRKALAKAREGGDQGKYDRVKKRYMSNVGQINHAAKTLDRIEKGELSRFNAPPSPALKKTERYANYVKTASAARTIAQEHKELEAIGLRTDGTANVHKRSSKRPEYDAKQKKLREFKSPLQPGKPTNAISDYQKKKMDAENHVIEGQEGLF